MGNSSTATSQPATPDGNRQLALRRKNAAPAAVGRLDVALLVDEYLKLAEWQQVPDLVRERYKVAADIKRTIAKVIKNLPLETGDYGYVFWNPKTREVWAVLSDSDDNDNHQRWHNALKGIVGVGSVRTEAEYGPHGDPDWIRIKRAAALEYLNKPFELAGKLTGGPSPLTNTIVGGLLGGGLGYAGGAVAEQFLPRRYFDRGRLRKALGLLGAGLGAVPGIWEGAANATNAAQAGKPLSWRTAITPTNSVPLNPAARLDSEWLQAGHYKGGEAIDWEALEAGLAGCPEPYEHLVKAAAGYAEALGQTGIGVRPVPMDAFNQAIWNDVSKGMSARNNPYGTKDPWGDNTQPLHTPPAVGAAAAGLLSGIGASFDNPPMLSPQHFISGLAAAGVDMVTARLAGGILGALGGLTPQAQDQLQNAGLWAGLIRGVTGSVLGL